MLWILSARADEEDPDVGGHGEDHLAVILRLTLLLVGIGDLADLGEAVHELRNVLAKGGLDLFERGQRILDRVVEQTRNDRRRIELHIGEDPRDFHRMHQVGLAGEAQLSLMNRRRKDVRLFDQRKFIRRQVRLGLVEDVRDTQHGAILCLFNGFGNIIDGLADRQDLYLAALADLHLHIALGQVLGPDGNAQGDTDEVRILEFYARPLVPVVEDHLHALRSQVFVDPFRRLDQRLVAHIDGRDDGVIRGNRHGPDDAVIVMVLLDAGGDGTAHADAVAPHDHVLLLPIAVEEGGAHGLAVLRPQLEDVSHLDSTGKPDLAGAPGTWIALADNTQIGKLWRLEVPAEIGVPDVMVFLVGADNHIAAVHEGIIGQDAALDPDGTDKTPGRTGNGPDRIVHGHLQNVALQVVSDLDLVDFLVPPDQDCYGLAIGAEDERLDDVLGRNLEERADLFDGPHLGRQDLLGGQELALVGRKFFGTLELRLLQVGRVTADAAKGHGILTRIGDDVEFMGIAAADAPRVRLDGAETQTAPAEDAVVGVEHLLVRHLRTGLVRIETVRVLHAEFAATHDAKPGPDLVAEFRLDLVEVEGKLPVGT